VISDPPYGITSAKCDAPFNLKRFWQLVETAKRQPGTPTVLFCNQPFTTDLINSNRAQFKYCWYWVKNNKTNYAASHKAPLRQLEEIAVFYSPPPPVYNNIYLQFDPAKVRKSKRYKLVSLYGGKSKVLISDSFKNTRLETGYSGFNSNVLFFDKPNTTTEYANHPFQKPIDLLEFLIKVYTKEGGSEHFYRNKPPERQAELRAQLVELMGNGGTVAEFCETVHTSKHTFYEALEEFPEFKEAYEIARTGAEAWFTKLFKMGMMGLRAVDDKWNIITLNPTLAIFYAKTRFGWRETETHEVKVSGGLALDAEAIKRLERNLTLFKREHEKT
jgi:hypothetical protein